MPSLALAALISTLLLVAMGSIVRVTGYGLGCPDWPLCYGRVVPPALTGAWVEFSHRLLGGATSLQIVFLGLLARRYYQHQPWVFRPAIAAVGLLIIQVLLGGLHVIYEIPPVIGWIHTAVAMLIVGLVATQVANTQPVLQDMRGAVVKIAHHRRFVTWVSLTAGATYLLLLTGSIVTRSGASLACLSFPLCGVPGRSILIDLHMLHRYTAYSITLLTLVTVIWLITKQSDRRLTRFGYGVGLLFLIQLGLGMANVLLFLPMWSRVLHLTVAATFWASLVVLWNLCRTPETYTK